MKLADYIGFCALAMSVIAMWWTAHGVTLQRGWYLRLASQPLWFTTAILSERPVYVATSIVYLFIDIWGVYRRRK